MSDTSADVEREYRRRLLQRSGAERLKMGCGMFTTVRTLVHAAIRERWPSLSTAATREALFRRLYGPDFPPDELERIATHVGRSEGATVPRRRLPVDLGDLEVALTSSGEVSHYLDQHTGEIVMATFEWDDSVPGPSREEIEDGVLTGRLLRIDSLGSSLRYRWMAEFAATVRDPRLRDRLEDALHGRKPFRRFDAALDDEGERRRWFALRDARLRAAARAWLAERDIEPVAQPRPGEG